MKKIFFSICAAMLSICSNATEVLSKEDASKTFGKSFVQWATSLMLVEQNKLGKTAIAAEYDWTMIVDQGHSILKITPSYLRDQLTRPHKISVGVQQSKELSSVVLSLSDVEIKKMIAKWHKQMLPEYTVMTEADLKGGIVQFNFTIFEQGRYPIMDALGKTTEGCWQECVKR